MMLYPEINELIELTGSRYTLVLLAAKRARDIIDGKPVLTEVDAERPVSLATNEVAEGKITYTITEDSGEESAEVSSVASEDQGGTVQEVTETAAAEESTTADTVLADIDGIIS